MLRPPALECSQRRDSLTAKEHDSLSVAVWPAICRRTVKYRFISTRLYNNCWLLFQLQRARVRPLQHVGPARQRGPIQRGRLARKGLVQEQKPTQKDKLLQAPAGGWQLDNSRRCWL